MRRKITLKPNANYPFDIGRMSLILIIRDTTRNVIFYGDSISEIELSRSDIVAVVKYQQQRVFLRNDNDVDITVEFQLSDVQISIREQRMALEGGVVVEEITTPIQVSEIQAPVKVSGVVPVSIDKAVPVLLESVAVSNFPEKQDVTLSSRELVSISKPVYGGNGQEKLLPQNLKRKLVMIQADSDVFIGDSSVSKFSGMLIKQGGTMVLETTSEIWIHATLPCHVSMMEEIF